MTLPDLNDDGADSRRQVEFNLVLLVRNPEIRWLTGVLLLLSLLCVTDSVSLAQETALPVIKETGPLTADAFQRMQSQTVAVVQMPTGLPATVASPLSDWLEARAGAILPTAVGGGVIIDATPERILVLTSSKLLGPVPRKAANGASIQPSMLVATHDGLQLPARQIASHPVVELAVLEAVIPEPFRMRTQSATVFSSSAAPDTHCVLISDPIGLLKSGELAIGRSSIRRHEWRAQEDVGSQTSLIPPTSIWRIDREREPCVTGCPVFDENGQCLGIVADPSRSDLAGTGLAVIAYSDLLEPLLADLRHGFEVEFGWLGFRAERATPLQLADVPLDVFPQPQHTRAGVRLTAIPELNEDEEIGLSPGQIVFALNGQPVRSPEELTGLIAQHRPGESIVLTLWKPDLEMVDQVTLTAVKAPLTADLAGQFTAQRIPLWRGLRVGFPEPELPTEAGGKIRLRSGVRVTSVERGSPAAGIGISPGDVIEKVGDRFVSSPQDFLEAVEVWDDETPLTLSGKTTEVFVPVGKKETR